MNTISFFVPILLTVAPLAVAEAALARRMHQQFRSSDPSTWPEHWRKFSKRWQRMHPSWQHTVWTDMDERALIAARLPEVLPLYDGLSCNERYVGIFRADVAAFVLVYLFGGVYADLDTYPHRPFDVLLDGLPQQGLGLFQLRPVRVESGVGPDAFVMARDLDRNVIVAPRGGHVFLLECVRSVHAFFRRHRERICGLGLEDSYADSEIFLMMGADSRMDLCVNAYARGDGVFDHAMVEEVEDAAIRHLENSGKPGGFDVLMEPYYKRFELHQASVAKGFVAYNVSALFLLPHDESASTHVASEDFVSSYYRHDHACSWCLEKTEL